MEERLDVCDGKYTIIYNEKTGEFRALRYCQEWRDLVGDKLILALFVDLLEAYKELDKERQTH